MAQKKRSIYLKIVILEYHDLRRHLFYRRKATSSQQSCLKLNMMYSLHLCNLWVENYENDLTWWIGLLCSNCYTALLGSHGLRKPCSIITIEARSTYSWPSTKTWKYYNVLIYAWKSRTPKHPAPIFGWVADAEDDVSVRVNSRNHFGDASS